MLRPLEGDDNPTPFFVTSDIETFAFPHVREGEVLAIDTCWRENDRTIRHISHSRWEEWWAWLVGKAASDDRFRVVYAHNGGGFDWLSLAECLLRWGRDQRESLNACCAGSKLITLNVAVNKRFNIHLCDSVRLLMSSLDSLGKKFVGRGKVDTGGLLPHELYKDNRSLFIKYHQHDTELLLEVLENAFNLLHSRIAPISGLGYTIGGLALKVFRTGFMDDEISIPRESFLKTFLRRGYSGGRVEVFQRGYFENVNVYDINSLYPSVMREISVPISERGIWKTCYTSEKIGCWEIRFNQHDTSKPPVLMVDGEGVYSGRGHYFTPEIECLLRVGGEIEVEKGYVFLDTKCIFKKYVDNLYALRMEDKNGPLGVLCKFLLNSLYGKFGQHAERESIIVDSSTEFADMVKSIGNKNDDFKHVSIRSINTHLGIFGITKKVNCEFEHVGIAGMITSAARVKLYEGMEYVVDNYGYDCLVYVDTDSLHVANPHENARGNIDRDIVGEKIGKFKHEFTGEGAYAGKKLYALRDGEGKEKIRAKGVSVGGNFGCKLSFRDIMDITKGDSIECEFRQFTTPRQVFAEKKPCQLQKRKRTLKLFLKKPKRKNPQKKMRR